jgi:multidrug efflux pump subunit AcrB
MITALDEVGGAVLMGGLTTFVGVLPLAFASSFIYRVFFRLFFCIVTLGIFHGFVVVPCLLISVPPKPNEQSTSGLQRDAPNENMHTATPKVSPQGTSLDPQLSKGEESL